VDVSNLNHDDIASAMGAKIKGNIPVHHGVLGSEQMAAVIAEWLGRKELADAAVARKVIDVDPEPGDAAAN
jgi:hypothetical protein